MTERLSPADLAAIRERLAQGKVRTYHEAPADIIRLLSALQAAYERIDEYENCITWDTTCANCARLLDLSYADYSRAEAMEATLARVRELCERADAASENEFQETGFASLQVVYTRDVRALLDAPAGVGPSAREQDDLPCPVCTGELGGTEHCPCCEQWNNGIDTRGRIRVDPDQRPPSAREQETER